MPNHRAEAESYNNHSISITRAADTQTRPNKNNLLNKTDHSTLGTLYTFVLCVTSLT